MNEDQPINWLEGMNKDQRIKWLQDKLCGLALGSHIRRRYEDELWRLLNE